MDEQGRSTFSEDQNGRILDRLAGLEKVISQEQITNALKATHKQSVRRCKLTNEIMILVVFAMGLPNFRFDRSSKPAERFAKARLRPADPQRTGHKEVHRLMTNLMDADEFPAMELIME